MIPIVPTHEVGGPEPVRVTHAFLAPGELHLEALPPLTLYVHIPWCVRKCPYCDFNSHEPVEGPTRLPERLYVEALQRDLEGALPLVWGRRVHAVFIGGGTPSLFSEEAIDRLLAGIRALLPLEADAEVTLEANPGTAEAGKFLGFRQAGVNRLSLGIQSFDRAALVALGRIHDDVQAIAAVELAQRSFDNINLDLMYALPGQTLEQAQSDLNAALSFSPAHLSLYQLTLEPNTVFAKYPPTLPSEDTAASMQDMIESATRAHGYGHYEVSAYARDAAQSRHNLNYWNFGDYLGIGAGAHSKLSFPGRIVRQVRYRQPATYLEHAARGATLVCEEHEVAPRDLPFEFMLNALRLVGGFPLSRYTERTGQALIGILPTIEKAVQTGLLDRDHLRLWPTELGRRFLNDLQARFLPD